MDHTIIPKEWKNFLSSIQTMFPSAIIAGGALRDTICDNQVKDVDIFIEDLAMDWEIDIEAIAKLFEIKVIASNEESKRDHVKLCHDIKRIKRAAKPLPGYLDPDNTYVKSKPGIEDTRAQSFINYIVDIQYNGTAYQLIFVEHAPIPFVYKDFDFGICKIYYDGIKLVVSDEFWYDYENKQLTIDGNFSQGQIIHTMLVHRVNMARKFPTWKVVVENLSEREYDDMPPSYKTKHAKQQVTPELKITSEKTYVDSNPQNNWHLPIPKLGGIELTKNEFTVMKLKERVDSANHDAKYSIKQLRKPSSVFYHDDDDILFD
jgi:hypothetical protein